MHLPELPDRDDDLSEIEDQDAESLYQQVRVLMPEPRTRVQTVLPRLVEEGYNASVTRRGKASRKDYAQGFMDGYRQAVEEYRRRMGDSCDALLEELLKP